MSTTPLKFRLRSGATNGVINRNIEVHHLEGDLYQVRTLDVIGLNMENYGLLTGAPGEKIAEAGFGEEVNGVPKMLEEAKAEATAIFEKYIAEGWEDANPLV
jgi:hypothetical protein